MIVSIGTSGVVAAVTADPVRDHAGYVAGFADGTGRYLPLVCTLNAARVLDAAAAMLRVDHDELSTLALSAPPGSEGVVMVPYLEGERTPNRPNATGALHGLRVSNANAANLARAAVEGLLCSLADGVAHLAARGVVARRILLVGGGALSRALREIAPAVFGMPVLAPAPAQYVAAGAARQAAWALSGSPGRLRGSRRRRTNTPPNPRPRCPPATRGCAISPRGRASGSGRNTGRIRYFAVKRAWSYLSPTSPSRATVVGPSTALKLNSGTCNSW